MNNSIGVIGRGFVGDSMYRSFENKGVRNLVSFDKYKNGGIGTFEGVLSADVLFLCLPTVFNHQLNQYDKGPILETCQKLVENNYRGTVVIKSTVEPGTTENLAKQFPLQFVHNPEFLTARTCYEDFHNQKHIVLGQSSACTDDGLQMLHDFYHAYYPDADISHSTAVESESMKSFVNCFYSVKVQFFNELYLVCQATGGDYNKIRDLMVKNGWINAMHTDVPGPDGLLSYGGLCFPKDTNALLQHMKTLGTPHKVLEATVDERNEMRDDHDNVMGQ